MTLTFKKSITLLIKVYCQKSNVYPYLLKLNFITAEVKVKSEEQPA